VALLNLSKKDKTKREIIINAERLETRVAVMEDGRLEEFQVEHPTQQRIVGSIFKGKVQNLEHDLQAAFVDIGFKRNAFLHYWDMVPDGQRQLEIEEGTSRRRSPRRKRISNEEIEKRFPPGSEIVVQVTKASIGTKGPRVTASLSIPGRYLVMVPGTKMVGVSRKIEDAKERQRLKRILSKLDLPGEVGLIVRTAASGTRRGAFTKDLRALAMYWEDLERAIREDSAPCCVYKEPDLVERVVRDWLTEDADRITIDSRDHFERIREIAGRISRKARSIIHLYEGEAPIFDHYQAEQQLEDAMRRTVGLKSGGCIVFDETEAMIAIDVNTGKHKGKGHSQEDAILEVNVEAVEEVARQFRLRNIGGLVVLDLIDMKSRKSQQLVYRAMKAALKRDRARTNVLPISELGLMEMTRQRVEESILSSMYVDCPYCKGRGHVKSPLGVSVEIQRNLTAIMRRDKRRDQSRSLQVEVHPTVLDRLRKEDEQFLVDLEGEFEDKLSFRANQKKHMARFAIIDTSTEEVLFSSDR
jgi:ribonuclease G